MEEDIKDKSAPKQSSRLPSKILRMDRQSIELYRKALEDGSENDYNMRLMVVGPCGVGKSTLINLLLEQDVGINKTDNTDGIDIHVSRCRISLKTSKWITEPTASRLPSEILRMDRQSIELYRKALEDGSENDYNMRLMVVGPCGVGKSTLINLLLEQDVGINKTDNTDGIDIHVSRCRISLKTSKWITEPTAAQDCTTRRIVKVLESTRTDLNGSSGLDVEETFEKGFTDDSKIHVDSSKEKSESPETSVDKRERERFVEMSKKNIFKEDDESPSVIYIREPSGSAQVEEHGSLLRQFKEVKAEAKRPVSDDDHASVSIWDFDGSFVFYTTYQMFLSQRAIYLLVYNMSQHIDYIIDDNPDVDCSEMKKLRIEDFLDIWLYAIHGQSKTCRQGVPPIIIVGTHADKLDPVNKEKEIDAVFEAIRNRFAEHDVSLHFIDKDFGLSNVKSDPKLEDLRQTIVELAKQQSCWGEMKPAKWICFEKVFDLLRSKDVQIISREDFEKLNQQLPVPIRHVEELELFLRFQHEVGNIMYIRIPELKGKIVLTPQFLVNALKSLITAETFCKKKPGINWREFKEKGILTTSLLDAVWNREENRQFQENREHILALMEHLKIIVRPVIYADDDDPHEAVATQQGNNNYFVPCILENEPPTSVLLDESKFISTPYLCLGLKNVAFPCVIFNRLLAGCISYWPLAKGGTQSHIYFEYGKFAVNKQHRLTISFSSNVIVLSVTRYSLKNPNPDISICQNVYSTVKQILKRIEENLSIEIKFEEYIQCPVGDTVLGRCMHFVQKLKETDEFPCHMNNRETILQSSNLLKYWMDPEETNHNISSVDRGKKRPVLERDIKDKSPPEQYIPKPMKRVDRPERATNSLSSIAIPKNGCWSSMAIQMHGYDKCKVDSEEDVLLIYVICLFLKHYLSDKIIHVWFGYQNNQQPVFVAIIETKTRNLEGLFEQHSPFPVIQRLPNEVSDEARSYVEKDAGLKLSFVEYLKLRDTLTKHSEHLMNSHSNLLAVSVSKVKCRKLGRQTEERPCLVLFVHVKGIIPVGEQPFPEKIGQFEVDVREAVFKMYSDSTLTMGSRIGNITSEKTGRLAGFVRLTNGKLGCFTCAHLFSESDTEVYQVPTYSGKPFGKILKRLFESGNKEITGVDVALIEITDILKIPDDGHLQINSNEHPLNSFEFTSGEILTSSEQLLDLYLKKGARCKIVRYNDRSQQMYVRNGILTCDVSSIRWWNPADPSEECQSHRQIEIIPDECDTVESDDTKFASKGDSGSLVFLESQTKDHVWAIGMVVGGCQNTRSAIVTPIWSILEKLGLPLRLESFEITRLHKIEQEIENLGQNLQHSMQQIQQSIQQSHQSILQSQQIIQQSLRQNEQSIQQIQQIIQQSLKH